MHSTQLMPVPFYEDTVVLVGQDNEPFVAMRPIVINMGLDWASQYTKLNEKFGSTVVEIATVAEDGKSRGMVCMPLRKLPAWLYSISPNKVSPALRDKIVRYQEECDDALWDYWTKGSATRAGVPNVTQQVTLSRHRLSLLKELHRTRDRTLRSAIHEQLAHTSRTLGLSVPELDSIGWAEPEVPDILAEFWDALEQLDEKGVRYNHSLNAQLIALRLPQLRELFAQYSIRMDITGDLRNALRQSRNPQYLDLKAVHSAIDGGTRKCWVFQR